MATDHTKDNGQTPAAKFNVRIINAINQLSASQWNSLNTQDYPFTRYEFLNALEESDCVSPNTGWQPCHILMEEDSTEQVTKSAKKLSSDSSNSAHATSESQSNPLIAAMPLYLKGHSYGEYVFDWAWADAYYRHNLSYYPKLLTAIPFTPATGPRLLTRHPSQSTELYPLISQVVKQLAQKFQASSWHLLFPSEKEAKHWQKEQYYLRSGCQFQWFNRNYQDFDEFLATLTARKRKAIRRERRKVLEQKLSIRYLEGDAITADHWQQFFQFYVRTYATHSGTAGYLNLEFFLQLHRTMPQNLVMMVAEKQGDTVAAALNFRSSTTLYGRYWGCKQTYDALHFELCYYCGIDYCIQHNLSHFDAGAQGEHKIQRGFEPVKTYSCHWLADETFRQAIYNYIDRETPHIEQYMEDAASYTPFKKQN